MRMANFITVKYSPKEMVIDDIGPWDKYPTVTNSAEEVVESLSRQGILKEGQRLLYYDSENELTELVHEDGRFVRFKEP